MLKDFAISTAKRLRNALTMSDFLIAIRVFCIVNGAISFNMPAAVFLGWYIHAVFFGPVNKLDFDIFWISKSLCIFGGVCGVTSLAGIWRPAPALIVLPFAVAGIFLNYLLWCVIAFIEGFGFNC